MTRGHDNTDANDHTRDRVFLDSSVPGTGIISSKSGITYLYVQKVSRPASSRATVRFPCLIADSSVVHD